MKACHSGERWCLEGRQANNNHNDNIVIGNPAPLFSGGIEKGVNKTPHAALM